MQSTGLSNSYWEFLNLLHIASSPKRYVLKWKAVMTFLLRTDMDMQGICNRLRKNLLSSSLMSPDRTVLLTRLPISEHQDFASKSTTGHFVQVRNRPSPQNRHLSVNPRWGDSGDRVVGSRGINHLHFAAVPVPVPVPVWRARMLEPNTWKWWSRESRTTFARTSFMRGPVYGVERCRCVFGTGCHGGTST